MNLFTYVEANPVNWVDPLGLDVVIVINRTSQTLTGTYGRFSVISTSDPSFMYTGYTFEPPSGGTNPKISAGTYSAYQRSASVPKIYNPPRIQLIGAISEEGDPMPGAQLHIGFKPRHTTGCALVSQSSGMDGKANSEIALKWINGIINTDRGKNITVIIYDPSK